VVVRERSQKSSDYIAIRRLSPLVNPPDDWLVCVIRAYLDGSASHGVIGLAAYVATVTDWDEFEKQWQGILDHHSIPGVHLSDVYERRDARAFKGKTKEQAVNAVADGSVLSLVEK
jgi:hypothetical protein